MSPKKLYYILIAVAGLSCTLIIASAVGGNMLFKKQAVTLNDLRVQSRVAEQQQVDLVQAKSDIEKYSNLDEIAKTIVPQDKNQAKTIREILNIAAQNGIRIDSITFPNSTLGQAAPKPTNTSSEEGSSTPKTASPAPNITQVSPVEGMQGIYALEITISPSPSEAIPYPKLISFLEGLEANRRTAHVSKINISPLKDKAGITFSLTLDAYLKPQGSKGN